MTECKLVDFNSQFVHLNSNQFLQCKLNDRSRAVVKIKSQIEIECALTRFGFWFWFVACEDRL